MAKAKKEAWDWCSKYIRLRDADRDGYCRCCTCGIIRHWKKIDAGHFIGRGIGGMSGVYFDERNIHAQCKRCNGFLQGNHKAYEHFMLEKYGQTVIDELRWLHKNQSYKRKIIAFGEMYKQMAKSMSVTKGVAL